MEVPKCKLCGGRHYGLCNHSPRLSVTTEQLVIGPSSQAPKYDRNEAHRAYMRTYMRKRRAAAKLRNEQE